MDKSFKINAFFDEKSEEVEKIIAEYLIFIKHGKEKKCLKK